MHHILFTIGCSNRSVEDFISLLHHHHITALADVRSVPYSRRNPQFNREPLKAELRSHSIDYVFLGAELGARPEDRSCYVDGKAVHAKIAGTALFKNGLERVKEGLRKGYVLSLMCAEKDPLGCHRAMLICRNLRGREIEIRHILDAEAVENHSDLEKRLVKELKLHPDLFSDAAPSDLIERAYDLQSDRIAYVEEG